jgi:mRNA interferase MazF
VPIALTSGSAPRTAQGTSFIDPQSNLRRCRPIRSCLVPPDDIFSRGLAQLVVVLPVTTKNRNIPLRVAIIAPEGGLKMKSYVMPEMIRSISISRLTARLGKITANTMALIEANVQVLLGF